MKKQKPTEAELEILQIIWEQGEATVKLVNETLSQKREVGYTTTLKLMQIMHEKGLLKRRKEGKTHIYRAVASREKIQTKLIHNLLHGVFKGSTSSMVMNLLGNESTSQEELDAIRKYLDEIDKKNQQ